MNYICTEKGNSNFNLILPNFKEKDKMIISHIKNNGIEWEFQSNDEHQEGVAQLSAEFASNFGMAESQCAEDMHQIFKSNIIPKPNEGKHCRNCSLIDICIPKTHKCIKVDNYLQKYLYEETS